MQKFENLVFSHLVVRKTIFFGEREGDCPTMLHIRQNVKFFYQFANLLINKIIV